MEYIGRIENDRILCKSKEGIVIFGAGKGLLGLMRKLDQLGIKDRILCICDNSLSKQGEKIEGFEIRSPQYAFRYYRKAMYIVYNCFCVEISSQLIDEGVEKIHLIR